MQILHANYSPDIWGQIWMAGSPTKELANLGVGVTEVTGQSQKTISNFAFLNHTQSGVKDVQLPRHGSLATPHSQTSSIIDRFPIAQSGDRWEEEIKR